MSRSQQDLPVTPIDATGDLDGVAFKDEASLSTTLRNHPNAASCFVTKVYEHAQGRAPVDVDAAVIASLSKQFDDKGHLFTRPVEVRDDARRRTSFPSFS